ncbi:MAG: LON peptidase substrate-binding domain-containing protein [Alphaproteobacteria bacterium]
MTGHDLFKSIDDLPSTIPLFPLAGALLLPRTNLPLNIFEPRYLKMVDDALAAERLIGMIMPRVEEDEDRLFPTGCAGRITAFSETDDGRYLITLTGVSRFRLRRELETDTPYRRAEADWTPFAGDLSPDAHARDVDRSRLLSALRLYLDRNDLEADWNSIDAAPTEGLVNALASIAPVETAEKQALLEAPSIADRAEVLVTLIELSLAGSDEMQDQTVQ